MVLLLSLIYAIPSLPAGQLRGLFVRRAGFQLTRKSAGAAAKELPKYFKGRQYDYLFHPQPLHD